jgi:nucleoside recognition membrane protein YjiH
MTALAGWENFYVIVGSSAGALIGLQFVAITLIAETPAVRGQEQAGAAFATPTIMHFSAVLLFSAILSAPWHEVSSVAPVLAVLGIVGLVYQVIVVRRMRSQSVYKPVFEDWLFHVLLPFVAYGILTASAFATRLHAEKALFGVAAVSLLLLFIGIHNTWDTVTWHVFVQRQRELDKRPKS